MLQVDPVILQLRADVAKYLADVRSTTTKVDQLLDQQEKSARRLEGQMGRSMGTIGGHFRSLATTLAAAFTARELMQIVDSAKQIEAQLRLATQESGNFAQAQDDVRKIAGETRSSLEATAALYASFARSSGELGISQEEVARITRTVTEAFKVSGATSAEASGAIRQLSQAFASGVLRGDEFNSMMEGAPRLAKLMADSMGVPVGALRAMAEEGQLTADKLVTAFTDTKFTAALDAEFREMPVTFGDAVEQIKTAATITFGAFDRGGEFSKALAQFVVDGADGFKELEHEAESLGIEIRATFEGLGDAFEPLLAGAQAVFGAIGSEAGGLAAKIRPLLGEIDAISGWIGQQGLGGRLLTGGSVSDWWNERPTRGTTLLPDFDAGYSRERGQRALDRIWRTPVEGLNFESAPGARRNATGASSSAGSRKRAGGGRGGRGRSGPSAADIEADFNDELRRLAEQAISAESRMAENAEDRAELEMRLVEYANRELEQKIKADKHFSEAQKARLLEQLAVTTDLKRQQVERQKQQQLERDAAQLRDAEYRVQQDAYQALYDLADSQGERKRLALEMLDLEQRYQRSMLEAVIASETASAAEKRRAQIALDGLNKNGAAVREGVVRQNETPAERYMRELNKSPEAINEAIDGIKIDGLDALNDGLVEAIMGTRSLGDVFKSVANQIIADLLRIAVQKMIVNSIAGAVFGGSGGGGGGLLGSIAKIGGKALGGAGIGKASGGYVNAGQMYRVNEAASAGRVEAFVPQDNGYIIPLGRMNAAAAQGGANAGKATVRLELSGDIDARIQQVSGPVAVQVVRASAPAIIDASARETMNRSRRPGL